MHGKKPTEAERKILESYGLDTYKWLVQKHSNDIMQIINRETSEEKVIKI